MEMVPTSIYGVRGYSEEREATFGELHKELHLGASVCPDVVTDCTKQV